MWGRKKDAGPAAEGALDLDEQIQHLRALVATSGGAEMVGPLIGLLSARATVASMRDRYDDALEDRRAAAGLLRGFDGQASPVDPATARLVWMGATISERRAEDLDAAVDAAQRALGVMDGPEPDDVRMYAAFLHDLEAVRLAAKDAGRTEDVVTVAAMSSDLATRLVEHDEPAYVAVLGLALVNEAAARANNGDRETAAAVNEEAIRILQERPDQAEGLKVALTNRAAWARREGRWDDAVATEQRMLAGVHTTQPDSRAEVDRLNQLFLTLVRAGRREEAEQTITDAIELGRRLAAEDPTRTVALAVLLGNQANLRGELGRHEDALLSSDEALALRERLAAEDPSPASTEGLAMVLNNHSVVLRRLGRYADAAAAAGRSVDLRRRNADPQNPNSLALLANALNSQAEHLGRLGVGERAVALALEAQDLFATLPAPGAKKPYLRSNQDTLGIVLAMAGRHEEAVTAARQAVALGRAAAAETPGEIPELAACLERFAERLAETGRTDEADSARAEATRVRASLAS
jgi:tetratricopeptide (TPR) repeat protein